MSKPNLAPSKWDTFNKEADQAITLMAMRHLPFLAGNELTIAKAHLKQFMMEFVELVNSDIGMDSDMGSKETLEVVYNFLELALKPHGIGFEEINDEYWVSNQARYLNLKEANNHEQ